MTRLRDMDAVDQMIWYIEQRRGDELRFQWYAEASGEWNDMSARAALRRLAHFPGTRIRSRRDPEKEHWSYGSPVYFKEGVDS